VNKVFKVYRVHRVFKEEALKVHKAFKV
jgi:hypothetical protein